MVLVGVIWLLASSNVNVGSSEEFRTLEHDSPSMSRVDLLPGVVQLEGTRPESRQGPLSGLDRAFVAKSCRPEVETAFPLLAVVLLLGEFGGN